MQHCNMQLACTVRWRNGKIVKSLDRKPKEKSVFVGKRCEAKKHRTEWCAAANKYRCMRCGRSSKHSRDKENVKDQSGCEKVPNTSWEDGTNYIWEDTIW